MAEKELQSILKELHQTLSSHKYQSTPAQLSRAKVALLHLNALIPSEDTPRKHLLLARETLELGAVISIRLKDSESFTRYFQQLQPFYSLPSDVLPKDGSQASKITGLYLLLLLSDGDYAGFHTLLETLEVAARQTGSGLEEDVFVQYPIRLEQALMEGSYDRVWGETKSDKVPSEEFGMFSEVSYTHVLHMCIMYAIWPEVRTDNALRFLSGLSVRRSPPAARRLTPQSPSRMPNRSYSSIPKAAS
jgi:hypothetical protein